MHDFFRHRLDYDFHPSFPHHFHSQTPYGPHLHSNPQPNGAHPQHQEEISTIFVVGFPEDMQEREFQNMFTFSSGFEAATLKIPNKEYNAYGTAASQPSARPPQNGLAQNYPPSYTGPNDPYNLVTVNQGGVVVDNGRDGTLASWPAAVPPMPQDDPASHFPGSIPSMPPRKQIIGFAKFRSRSEALDARDQLQGRRVDIEKGAVLKAEMAKKNLHTKRGVGPLPLPIPGLMAASGSGALVVPDSLSLASGLGALSIGGIETMSARERELGAIGAMGLGGMSHWRDRIPDNDDDRRLAAGTRGPRERAEEDERERERRRKDKEARMRSANLTAFDAFHSVPAQTLSRHPSNSLLSCSAQIESLGASPIITNGFGKAEDEYFNGSAVGPWDSVTSIKKSSVSILTNPPPIRPPSSQSSPATRLNSFSPQSNSTDLPLHGALRSHQNSPPPDFHPQFTTSSQPGSSASSVAGGSQTHGSEAIGPLAVTTDDGNNSPQLPSPVSGTSSTSTRNFVDQNPPINTLYVGNLPTSPVPPGYPPNYLEDSLRELFQRRPGFRKLCFRQKINGPMCFVEFEDVNFATKALNDLYGSTLGGLVKGGGIRLSYSKNPLGVRTPTSAGSNGPCLQQQQQTQTTSAAPSLLPDTFQYRSTVEIGPPFMRRDSNAVTSPQSTSFNYLGSPPPRFFSPTPSSSAFGNPSVSLSTVPPTASFPRTTNGFGGVGGPSLRSNGVLTSTFSPFGISTPPPHSTIPASD